jgi:hypothetical protein
MNERAALSNVQKGPQVRQSGVRTPNGCSTPVSTWSSSRMDHPRTTLRMSLPSACMRKSIPRGTISTSQRNHGRLSKITDHRSDHSAFQIADGFTTSCSGIRVPKSTTRGWSLLVSWKDGSSDWVPLKDLNDSYPIQIAEYAMANKIANETAFNWWVHTVLRKRNCIVAKVKRYWQTTHKFGIRLPKTVAEALTIDDQTGTDLWRKALRKKR